METLTTSNGQATKTTRKIRPRVLKSDYDLLQRKYTILRYVAGGLLIAFIIALKFAV